MKTLWALEWAWPHNKLALGTKLTNINLKSQQLALIVSEKSAFIWTIFLNLWVKAKVLGGLYLTARRIKLALRRNLYNLHALSQYCSFYSFRDHSVHTDMARSPRLVILTKIKGNFNSNR